MKKYTLLLSVLSMLLFTGCIAMSPYEKPIKFAEGSVITTSIKSRLINTNGLDSFQINVSTLNGDVLLSGFVANDKQRLLAQKVTENTKGVRRVINHIEIIP